MYIPKHYRQENREKILTRVREYPLGALISAKDQQMEITLLPFIVKQEGDKIFLDTHLTAENPHAKILEGSRVKVLFQGPSSYISPSWYPNERSVPTWNYLAVEATGNCILLHENQEKLRILRDTIAVFEPQWMDQWNVMEPAEGSQMLPYITGIRVEVTDLICQEKLSQNKDKETLKIITDRLTESENLSEQGMGSLMKRFYSI